MSDRNTLPIDLDRARMRLLLEDLALEKLDKDGAQQLIPLLEKEQRLTRNIKYQRTLTSIIYNLERYLRDEVNLMRRSDVNISIG